MRKGRPSYEELKRRCLEAEAAVAVLRADQGERVSGEDGDRAPRAVEAEARLNEEQLRSLLNILQRPSGSVQELLDHALEEAIQLTGSKIGYIYHYHEDRKQFVLNTWSRDVMPACSVANPLTCYELAQTGIWGEAVRQRKPMVLNDFQATHPLKKGYPEGHVRLLKFLTVPVCREERIVGVVGVANKETDYTETDVLQLTLLMEAVWKVTDRREAEEALTRERNQLLSIFDGIGEAVYIADPETYELLFANKTLRNAFGEDLVGGRCHERLQGLRSPCPFCTNDLLIKADIMSNNII